MAQPNFVYFLGFRIKKVFSIDYLNPVYTFIQLQTSLPSTVIGDNIIGCLREPSTLGLNSFHITEALNKYFPQHKIISTNLQ